MLTTQQASDFARYARDPVAFIREQVKIRTIDQGIILFPLYEWQEKLIYLIMASYNIIVLKSRQVGVSWIIGAFIVWLSIFRRHQEVLILSRNGESARTLLRNKILFMVESLPKWIVGNEEIYIGESIKVPARFTIVHAEYDPVSRVYVPVCENVVSSLTTTTDSGSGETPNFVFLDEWAKLPHSEETWTALKPALSRGGQIVGGSTPKGHNNSFASVWGQWLSGTLEGWQGMEVSYEDCGFDDEWLVAATSGMTEEQVQQEFHRSFLQSGRPVFNARRVAAVYRPLTHPGGYEPLMAEYANILTRAGLANSREDCEAEYDRMAAMAESGKEFFTGVDSSEGKGKDFNSITTVNEFGVQVATEHNHSSISEWAGSITRDGHQVQEAPGFVSDWHTRYPGIMVIEENGPGLVVYNNHVLPRDAMSRVYKKRTMDTAARTGMKTKLILTGQRMIESKLVIITDRLTYKCLMDFSYLGDTGRTGAPKGLVDDPVFSWLWAVYALNTYGTKEISWPDASKVKGRGRIFHESAWSVQARPYGYSNRASAPRVGSSREEFGIGSFDAKKLRGPLRRARLR